MVFFVTLRGRHCPILYSVGKNRPSEGETKCRLHTCPQDVNCPKVDWYESIEMTVGTCNIDGIPLEIHLQPPPHPRAQPPAVHPHLPSRNARAFEPRGASHYHPRPSRV
ncbi:hypothetical protein KC355_g30 [Hortaea werneckii]|nr:hypothetical protein KC355_g30 [Hortaea werneckii]